MKKEYKRPVVAKLEFDYTNVIASSTDDGNPHKADKGHGVSQTDVGCNQVPGHDNANS